MKRGQVAIFVILAIVLIAAGTFTFLIKNNSSANNLISQNNKPELNNVKNSISECRGIGAAKALEDIGIQGGYYDKPERYFDLGWTFIPYYYDSEILMPEKAFIEIELGKDMDKQFTDCINNLKSDGFEIEHGISKTKSTITKGNVLFKVDMSLRIRSDNDSDSTTIEMNKLPLNVNSSLYDILEVAKYISDSHKKDSNLICVTCVDEMAEERNLYVNVFDVSDNSVLYVISENHTSSQIYSFEFMNKYAVTTSGSSVVPTVPSGPSAA